MMLKQKNLLKIMKIKNILYQTPEMTEDKLIEIIDKHLSDWTRRELRNRVQDLHKSENLANAFMTEYDLIQDKKSYLSKSQRDDVLGFVGLCMIQMTKGDGK